MKFKYLLLFLLFFCTNKSKAFDTTIVTQLLHRIEQLQVKENGVFPKGLFPCYRMYWLNKDREIADPNIAFTGYIIYTLNSLMPSFTPNQTVIANKIIKAAEPVFKKYKNKKNGRPTYNFWTTDTVSFFPNSGFLTKLTNTHSLADDLDDTGLISMGLSVDDSTAKQVHDLMQQFTKNGKKEINHFFQNYQKFDTYSTWFGKKMPVEIDISVLSNILLFVQSYDLPWTKIDSSSVQLIVQIIEDKKHISEAEIMSHYYASPALILYHVSRLMAKKDIPELSVLKSQMIEEAKILLSKSNSFVEKIILSTTLIRWGIQPEIIRINHSKSLENLIEEDKQFAFFIANLAYLQIGIPDSIKKWVGKIGLGKFLFFCPAYNNVLLLENIILQKKLAN